MYKTKIMAQRRRRSSEVANLMREAYFSFVVYRPLNECQKKRRAREEEIEEVRWNRQVREMKEKKDTQDMHRLNHTWHDDYCDCGNGRWTESGKPPKPEVKGGCPGWCGCPVNKIQENGDGLCIGCRSFQIERFRIGRLPEWYKLKKLA